MSERRGEGKTRSGALARRAGAMLAVLALLVAGAYLLRVPLLTAAGRWLVVDDPARPADLIFLLNGDSRETARARHAAQLFHRGLAPRILIARAEDPPAAMLGLYPNETDVNLGILRRLGVPDSALVVLATPGGVTSTTDEARVLRAYLADHDLARVLVVTSRYHTRRARWNLRRALADRPVSLQMAGAPHPDFDETDWWRSERGMITHFSEYLKFVHNWIYR